MTWKKLSRVGGGIFYKFMQITLMDYKHNVCMCVYEYKI